jgi:CheY-like chemotaxis protein/tetratricopeptide (TPR) repeat protein
MEKGNPHMNLADSRLDLLDNTSLSSDERALRRCRLASEFTHVGQYEAALEALGDLWRGVGERPGVEGLKPLTAAELLLQAGVLSGWLGSVRHISGVQERAKDLLSEALRAFKSERRHAKVSEAQYELGMCYWRLGAFDESRVVLDEALKGLGEQDTELKAQILVRHTLVEVWTGRYHDAWNVLERAREFFESCNDALKGKWHGQRAIVLMHLATTERRSDYTDRAIIEFTAAIHHYEQAGHERYCAINLNNLAFLLYKIGRYREAHENLDRAQRIFQLRKDSGILAQVNETRARVLVAEGRYAEANRIISGVIESFQKGGEHALLADAMTIQGVVWARLGKHDCSIQILRRAFSVAQDSGSFSNAGLAALSLIEEHGRERMSETSLYDAYRRADELLKGTQDADEIARLRACARLVTRRLVGPRLADEGFVLSEAVRAYEARFIREALEAEGGVITRTAERLGIRHQSLTHLLATRHKNLLALRIPAKARRRSIVRPGAAAKPGGGNHADGAAILHVEDDEAVADAVSDTLAAEGRRVDSCADAGSALKKMESDSPYALLIFDYDLPGLNGMELVRRARRLRHRRETPIVMLSAREVEAEAREAGVDVFLRKPEGIIELTSVVARLLSDKG